MSRVKDNIPAVAGILAASIALGLAYNSASPLGIRGKRGDRADLPQSVSAKQEPLQAAATKPVAAKTATNAYENRTVAISIEPDAPPTPGPQPIPHSHSPAPIQNMTWAEVKPLLATGRIVLIDARAAAAYESEHIPGALSLPAGSPAAEIGAFVTRHGKDAAYVIYCGSGQCGLSKMAAEALLTQGCANVKVMPGGFSEYRVSESKAGSAQ